jgi:3-hydroxymyristoyl/3-hydroxydecanoyl-(acyl carrier protein) dehydratase
MNSTLSSEIVFPANHPSLAGHFPGQPVVPAVVLLDAVLAAIRTREACVLQSIPVAKFLQPVLPEERIELRIEITAMEKARWRASFRGFRAESMVFEGSFVVSAQDPAP